MDTTGSAMCPTSCTARPARSLVQPRVRQAHEEAAARDRRVSRRELKEEAWRSISRKSTRTSTCRRPSLSSSTCRPCRASSRWPARATRTRKNGLVRRCDGPAVRLLVHHQDVEDGRLAARRLLHYTVPPLEGLWWTSDEAFDGQRAFWTRTRFLDLAHPPARLRHARSACLDRRAGRGEEARARSAASPPRAVRRRTVRADHAQGTVRRRARHHRTDGGVRRRVQDGRRHREPSEQRGHAGRASMRTEACPQCACTTRSTWAIRAAPSRRTSRR